MKNISTLLVRGLVAVILLVALALAAATTLVFMLVTLPFQVPALFSNASDLEPSTN